MEEKLLKWRMILGKNADEKGICELSEELLGIDNTLNALYDSNRKAGLGSSSPNVNRWLGDIREYFPSSVVQMMQKDAMERLGLKKLLLEPETLENVQPDVDLAAAILSLNKILPTKSRETAQMVVRKVVENLEKKLKSPLLRAIKGALHRSAINRRPRWNEIDWHKTIKINLKHYQSDYKTIIPVHLRGSMRRSSALRTVVLMLDQSGSMASSVVYAGIYAAILASLRSLKTHIVAFDTNVIDLTEHLEDPVELLFGTQLGGGTDINRALMYVENLISKPSNTIVILISDLFEGGNEREMLRRVAYLKQSGVQFISLLALNDEGAPAYNKNIAGQLTTLDIPVFACTPDKFPEIMAAAIQGSNIATFIQKFME